MKEEHYCRICGLYMKDKPWGDDGQSPTYEICPCCGVEFGNEDYDLFSIKEYRKEWLKNGANWFDKKKKPVSWDVNKQLMNVPEDFD